MSFIQSIRHMLYKYGTSSVPSNKPCCCKKTLKNMQQDTRLKRGNGYTRKQRRTGRRRNKRRNRI